MALTPLWGKGLHGPASAPPSPHVTRSAAGPKAEGHRALPPESLPPRPRAPPGSRSTPLAARVGGGWGDPAGNLSGDEKQRWPTPVSPPPPESPPRPHLSHKHTCVTAGPPASTSLPVNPSSFLSCHPLCWLRALARAVPSAGNTLPSLRPPDAPSSLRLSSASAVGREPPLGHHGPRAAPPSPGPALLASCFSP